MGKRILAQRKGRGSPTFISPSWLREGPVRYPPIFDELLRGVVKELIHVPGLNAPVAKIVLEDGTEFLNYAAEGMYVGQLVHFGSGAPAKPGNITQLKYIPEGTYVYNIEKRPGDGGKFARSSGTYGVVLGHRGNKTLIQLPSGASMEVGSSARATIGIVAGGGRPEKPFVKAGKKFNRARTKAWKYPTVRGKAMSPYAHPHGGGSHPTGSTPVKKTAPPGQKVGFYGSRCTGRGCRRARAQLRI